MTSVFADLPLPIEFACGLTSEAVDRWVAYASCALRSAFDWRSSVSAIFDAHDGRRIKLPKSCGEPGRVAQANRYVDHWIAAMDQWARCCLAVGEAMVVVAKAVVSQTATNDECIDAAHGLMLALLTYYLVGRPTLKSSLKFATKIFCYRGKFLLQDHLLLLRHRSCEASRAGHCGCRVCGRYAMLSRRSSGQHPARC